MRLMDEGFPYGNIKECLDTPSICYKTNSGVVSSVPHRPSRFVRPASSVPHRRPASSCPASSVPHRPASSKAAFFPQISLTGSGSFVGFRGQRVSWTDGPDTLENCSVLGFKGKFALPAIHNDLLSRPPLLWNQSPLRYFLHAMDEFDISQRPARVGALSNESKPGLSFPSREVLPPC